MNWGYGELGDNQKPLGLYPVAEPAPQVLGFTPITETVGDMPASYGQIEAAQLATCGSTITDEDIERLKAQVEPMVRQMIAEGRSDEEIRQAVELLPYQPELKNYVREITENNLDTDKFNMFSTRNQQCEQDQHAMGMLAALGVCGGQECSPALLGLLSPLPTPNLVEERGRGIFA